MDQKKILIVEDEEVLLKALERKLTHDGYQVILAEDGAKGLAAVREHQPDLILLDILMPNLDGFGVLEQLKTDGVTPNLPVIVISNSGQPVEIDRALKLGARDYLIKAEFDPEEVVEKVRAVLGDPAPASAAPTASAGGATRRVLIVEDDQFLRDLMERKLKKEGFEVQTAIEGESALGKIAEWKPELVLLDIILPGLDGFSILVRVGDRHERVAATG